MDIYIYGKTFRKEEDNPTKDHINKVKEWRDKWIEVFDDDEAIWLLNNEAKPATIYANPKTHKRWLAIAAYNFMLRNCN